MVGHLLWRVLLAALMKRSGGFIEETIAQDWGSRVGPADSGVLKPPGLVHGENDTSISECHPGGALTLK